MRCGESIEVTVRVWRERERERERETERANRGNDDVAEAIRGAEELSES